MADKFDIAKGIASKNSLHGSRQSFLGLRKSLFYIKHLLSSNNTLTLEF